jgi:hypothetical protein
VHGKALSSLDCLLDPMTQDAWSTTSRKAAGSAAGKPRLIDRDTALLVRDQIGYPLAGQFQFKPLWDHVITTDPDLFD